jgi:hypothetical protein
MTLEIITDQTEMVIIQMKIERIIHMKMMMMTTDELVTSFYRSSERRSICIRINRKTIKIRTTKTCQMPIAITLIEFLPRTESLEFSYLKSS